MLIRVTGYEQIFHKCEHKHPSNLNHKYKHLYAAPIYNLSKLTGNGITCVTDDVKNRVQTPGYHLDGKHNIPRKVKQCIVGMTASVP